MTYVGAGVALILALGVLGLPPSLVFCAPVLIGAAATLALAHFGGAITAPAVAKRGVPGLLAGAALAVSVVGLGAFTGGVAASLLSPPDFDFVGLWRPVYWLLSVGGVPAIALGCVHAVRAGRERATDGRARVAVIAALVLLAPVATCGFFVDRHEIVVHEMRVVDANAQDDATHALVFVHFPNHRDEIWAPGFDAFVESRPGGIVKARYRVMRDFGRVRGCRLLDIEGWDGPLQMRGGSAYPGPSPWE